MAEVLKFFYPRLVDIHNYPPTNSLVRKITNWATLNNKILSKIGLSLNKNDVANIARAGEGAIENVLYSLYNKLRAEREEKLLQEQQERNLEQNVYILQKKNQAVPVSGIPVKTDLKNGSRVILVTEKIVPISEVEKISAEIAEKNETILALSSKVSHYEKLLKLKNDRISDLLQQLQLTHSKLATYLEDGSTSAAFPKE